MITLVYKRKESVAVKMLQEIALILCILLPASLEDIRHLRVSNAIIIYGLCLSLFFRLESSGFYALPDYFIGLALPFLFGFILYKAGVLGASDVKLFSVICSNYSISQGLFIIAISFLVGAIFSVFLMIRCHTFGSRLMYFYHFISQLVQEKRPKKYFEKSQLEEGSVIPFAVCISLGTVTQMLVG